MIIDLLYTVYCLGILLNLSDSYGVVFFIVLTKFEC